MKCLSAYIKEAMTSKILEFFTDAIKNNRGEGGNETQFNVNVKTMECPKQITFTLDDFRAPDILEMITDKNIGFPIMQQILAAPDKMFGSDNETVYEPTILPFFAGTKEKRYFVGIVLIDANNVIVKDYVTMLHCEVPNCIKNKKAVLTAMNMIISNTIKRENNHIGICARPVNRDIANNIKLFGLTRMKEDNMIFINKL